MADIRSRVEGEFSGFDDDAIFRLSNGQVWQQAIYKYHYYYAYQPHVTIRRNGSGYIMEVPSMRDSVAVVPIDVVTEGVIVSEFRGFSGNSKFQFNNGQVWEQAEYKYAYCYAYRPEAIVVNGINGLVLRVEGMEEQVRVRRVK